MPTDVKETKAEPKKLKITLIKSTIGAVPKNRKIDPSDQPHGQGGRTGLREVQNGIIKFKTC